MQEKWKAMCASKVQVHMNSAPATLNDQSWYVKAPVFALVVALGSVVAGFEVVLGTAGERTTCKLYSIVQ